MPKVNNKRAKSTDCDKLTANLWFRYSDLVTHFVAVISSQSEGLGKMALGIVKIYLGSPFSANRVARGQFVCGQFVAVSCRGPNNKRTGCIYVAYCKQQQ